MLRKILMIGGILVILFLGFKVWGWINRDDTRPLLDQLSQTNSLIIALSESASDTADYQLRITAGNIHTVVLSNNQLLAESYREEFGKKPATKSTAGAVDQLEAKPAGSGFDQAYVDAVKQALEANQQTLTTLAQKNRPKLKEVIGFIQTEQAELLTQLP
ncbi:hypothetical protein HY346_03225 [Candidatus Microgenomates bacterium]|nr:hypothetical protein [Candidatus Microgenomates bacterium]